MKLELCPFVIPPLDLSRFNRGNHWIGLMRSGHFGGDVNLLVLLGRKLDHFNP